MNNHQKFLKHLDISSAGVFRIAKWFYSQGVLCTIMPMETPAVYKESARDHGDLLIQHRVEVKRLSSPFTSEDDWPHDEFFVCATSSYNSAFPKPYKFIYLNHPMTHIATIDVCRTRHAWTKSEMSDKRYGDDHKQEVYVCPIELVKWERLDDA